MFYFEVTKGFEDEFTEELLLKTLPTGQIYSHFQFTTLWKISNISSGTKHYRLFPRSLGEVFEMFSVKELHLSFTQNKWQHDAWGLPVVDASKGAELVVWFSSKILENDVEDHWKRLVNVLSGMFCASLNFMDTKATINPRFVFRLKGFSSETFEKNFSSHVKYAILPNENVCTENLTPWKKLLPCGFRGGLSTLLNSFKLYDTSYHSLAIHFRPVCLSDSCHRKGIELVQSLGVVFDPLINLGNHVNVKNWSFKRYFGRIITVSCPVASVSKIYFDLSVASSHISLSPPPSYRAIGTNGAQYMVYELNAIVSQTEMLNLNVNYKSGGFNVLPSEPLVSGIRRQTGQGQVEGGILCLISNRHPFASIPVLYMEVLPFFLRTYIHTLKIESFTGQSSLVGDDGKEISPHKVHYVPGKDNGRPYQLEIVFELPPNSVTRISIKFEKQILKWTDYPPDPNHGFYIPPSIISILLPSSENLTTLHYHQSSIKSIFTSSTSKIFLNLHTDPLLIILPTPDFSMPYNVICLVCTVIAIAFGSLHNLTTKNFVIYDKNLHKGLAEKVKEKFKNFWKKKNIQKTTN